MKRRNIVAGNWKMNLTVAESRELAVAVLSEIGAGFSGCDVGVAPTFVALTETAKALDSSSLFLAAQNCHFENEGAYTGEISARMLLAAGCSYVIIGHSERRQLFGETDAIVNRKVAKALQDGLKVIFCVGETLDERESGITGDVVTRQVKGGLAGIDGIGDLVIAYEPVWAIGTGKTATSEQAQEVHALIRGTVAELYGAEAADGLRIQYGGSVKPSNAVELFAMPDIDGGLIGGASLNAADFAAIVKAAC
ncbi:MAG: triose-phosphate isomerase [Chlorobium sp.]|jgi:triosephosphate isomerase|uniref:triose-phosphate isomerase n=1 Tax=Chlorobium sp. TaxID=1095 RepID=UPI001D2E0CAE|nr:triose-phosphate isomerase [Chlorobium sp.]MBN1279887.1 triose-phosphate isomerase [Chlorobiaceae bacterium]MCF8215608.1 triose-phosphate isomerase [Chlorobium sp.]MCF8270663.1 triose-phosphate isomerase [Chlorobium sp.]MCF8286817.1 triose-phosphate isomerase [Chlorobium sp.]MCF8290607.1 triose-phosphate isomerase [Chlorobium sp.]